MFSSKQYSITVQIDLKTIVSNDIRIFRIISGFNSAENRFDTRNNTWLYDLIANNLGFGALVKLSDYGEKEQERAVKEIRRNEKARAKMQMPGAAK